MHILVCIVLHLDKVILVFQGSFMNATIIHVVVVIPHTLIFLSTCSLCSATELLTEVEPVDFVEGRGAAFC